ncbi:hypothetical protein TVAG_239570 [Trichomonas vaginalis G3]|uniref:Uncharacterized protein n=1 Tax=Trichomonas vaginalis (strain ATCC PRA-98 / G3) TaxID=412133 RepID=A2DGI4_TRIV3|nr:hypothetical protein TVAGG3_0965770 [Trichomonas vaginalis G3]EAY20580.1 hypothetical protein TVAG_239570 [Trichomonas vaginalis G3]KAI5488226.1 hypothetical protein TVAGG3_0965770 [Trichomonas vaginalis G3]|eukprot:XP_001581566.1 hypothetical protein [Trichomonas vaginalis G3]
MKKSKAHFLWLLYTLSDKCNDTKAKELCQNLDAMDSQEFLGYFSDIKTYILLTNYIFDVNTDAPIDILHNHGYYRYGDASIFAKSNFDEIAFINLIECYMWASLDRKIPTNVLVKKVGRTKVFSLNDPEAIICSWINTCCSTYTKLRPVTSISQYFIGSNQFRALLYSYTRDESLLQYSDPKTNAEISLRTCSTYGIKQTFEYENYQQSPLVIMCFLVDAIAKLDSIKPLPRPRTISRMDMQRIEKNISDTKKEVESLKIRCGVLANDVNLIAARLVRMKRPSTSISAVKSKPQLPVQMQFPDGPGLPPLHDLQSDIPDDRPKSALHVKWEIPVEMLSNRGGGKLKDPQSSPVESL